MMKIMVKSQSSFIDYAIPRITILQAICPKLASRSGRWSHNIGHLRHPFFVPGLVSTACNHIICVQRDMGLITGKMRHIRCREMLRVWVSRQSAGCCAVFASPCPGSAPAPVFLWTLFIPLMCLGRSATRNINSWRLWWQSHTLVCTNFLPFSNLISTLLLLRVLGDLAKYALHKSYWATYLMLLLMGNSHFFHLIIIVYRASCKLNIFSCSDVMFHVTKHIEVHLTESGTNSHQKLLSQKNCSPHLSSH